MTTTEKLYKAFIQGLSSMSKQEHESLIKDMAQMGIGEPPANEQPKEDTEMETYTRNAVMTGLKKYCHLAKESDCIEVCEWGNGEGFDVAINTDQPVNFQLTWGEWELLKILTKKLENH